jgi:hypothetical protein
MTVSLPAVLGIALIQGMALHGLHRLAEDGPGGWSELVVLLPAYAVTLGVPLTAYLLHTALPARALGGRLAAVGLALAATAAYVGWVNGPVGTLRPATGGSVLLYAWLAFLAWFVALPFLRSGLRGSLTPAGYAALFDEAWRLAITLAFALLFVGLFWGLLGLFVRLFQSIGIPWPKDLVGKRYVYYPATCAAASFAIGLSDVRPEMFRALRQLLLGVLRWLTVLAAAIVLLFLAALLVQGVGVLWGTRFATGALISLSVCLVTLYNAVYQDGSGTGRLPAAPAWLVRAALIAGPALAALAYWALGLRLAQHGASEDRLYALVVVTILAGYLAGYAVVALGGGSRLQIRHVNVVMACAVVATLLAVHSPALDLKRLAVRAQVARVDRAGDRFDLAYLRHDAGRHGILALQALAGTRADRVAERARGALAEANRRESGPLAGPEPPSDLARLVARLDVYPRGAPLPEGLAERLFAVYRSGRWRLPCIDTGPACAVLLVDLDGDGQQEAVVLLFGEGRVYAPKPEGWIRVGRLVPGLHQTPDQLREALAEGRWRLAPPPPYQGLELGSGRQTFVPEACEAASGECPGPLPGSR